VTPTLERVVWPFDRRLVDDFEVTARIKRVYAASGQRKVRLRDRLLSMLTTRASS
jgi:hypothetical protein